jgi:outer membrane immunogenic protein
MSKIISYPIVALLALGACSVAQAADLPVKAPARTLFSPDPAFSWTGFYIGGNVGWNWVNLTTTDTGPAQFGQVFPIGTTSSIKRSGFMGGAQIGYNYQMGNYVVGLDADFDWSATKFKQDGTLGTLSFSTSYKNNYISTFGARFGYAFDRLLVYGKAGGAWTQDDFDFTASDGSELSGRFDRWGWMVGGGVEYAISHNWTVKAEYNYLDFGTKNEVLTPNATDLVTGSITADANDSKLTAHVVKIGVNYIFH